MKIAVNTRFLLKNKLEGFGWFTYETLRRMVTAHPEDEFIFLFDRPYDAAFVFSKNVTPVVLFPPARHPFLFVWWYEWSVARALKKHKPDIFLSTDNFCSLRTHVPTYLMLHDVGWAHPEAKATLPWLVYQYYQFFAPRFLKKAHTIICVSEFVKQDALRYYAFLNPQKLVVCHNGCRTDFQPLTTIEKTVVRTQYTEGVPFFVFVGAVHPRKNVHRLIAAFSEMKIRTGLAHKLMIVGRFAWQTGDVKTAFEQSSFQKDIIFTGYIADAEVPRLVGAATAVTYISLAEGFGIPILEAMHCDVPVVTSNVTSMPEVAGDAAILVNPLSISEIADALEKLATDADLCQNLLEKGRIQREKFSWDKTAVTLYEVLKLKGIKGAKLTSRKMTASEQGLVLCLLKESKIQLNINVKEVKVIDMEDGGMGSLYFVNDKPWQKRLFGKCISEKTFVDIDEMGISITLNVDKDGDLFELDIWRYDYKPLKKYPQC